MKITPHEVLDENYDGEMHLTLHIIVWNLQAIDMSPWRQIRIWADPLEFVENHVSS